MVRLFIIILLYIVILISFTLYWGDNFVDYTLYKGDESTLFVKVSVGLNYLMLVLTAIMHRKINLMFLFISPLLNTIIAFILGLIFLLSSGISGIPRHTFYVFTPLFIISSLLSLFVYYRRFRTSTNSYGNKQ
jgi:hypothetical protein